MVYLTLCQLSCTGKIVWLNRNILELGWQRERLWPGRMLSGPRGRPVSAQLYHCSLRVLHQQSQHGLFESCMLLEHLHLHSHSKPICSAHFQTQPSALCTIHLEEVDRMCSSAADVMTQVLQDHEVPESKHMMLFTHIRLAHAFSNFKQRTSCILARLQAISILGEYPCHILTLLHSTYISICFCSSVLACHRQWGSASVCVQWVHQWVGQCAGITPTRSHSKLLLAWCWWLSASSYLYLSLWRWVISLLLFSMQEMKAAVLRTLTAVIHLERNPKQVHSYIGDPP